MRSFIKISHILALLLFLGQSAELYAANTTQWDGSSSTNWNTAANWSNGVPTQLGDPALIVEDGNGIIDIANDDVEAHSLTLTTDADEDWTITGGSGTLTIEERQGISIANESDFTLTFGADVLITDIDTQGANTILADTGDIIFNGSLDLGTTVVPIFDANSGRSITTNGILSGTTDVTKNGAGDWEIGGSSSNTYAGSITINDGTVTLNKSSGDAIAGGDITLEGGSLVFNGSNQIDDSTDLILSGGDVELNGNSETLGSLTLDEDSTIDFGDIAGSTLFTFADDGGADWAGELFITGWNGLAQGGGSDQLTFGSILQSNVDRISFIDPFGNGQTLSARLLASGEVVPVPEPGSLAAGIALLASMVFGRRYRRRCSAV